MTKDSMKVFPTMEPIEVIDNDIYIDGKLIDSFDKVELTECNEQAYLGCFNYSARFDTYLSEDCFKVEIS